MNFCRGVLCPAPCFTGFDQQLMMALTDAVRKRLSVDVERKREDKVGCVTKRVTRRDCGGVAGLVQFVF